MGPGMRSPPGEALRAAGTAEPTMGRGGAGHRRRRCRSSNSLRHRQWLSGGKKGQQSSDGTCLWEGISSRMMGREDGKGVSSQKKGNKVGRGANSQGVGCI